MSSMTKPTVRNVVDLGENGDMWGVEGGHYPLDVVTPLIREHNRALGALEYIEDSGPLEGNLTVTHVTGEFVYVDLEDGYWQDDPAGTPWTFVDLTA